MLCSVPLPEQYHEAIFEMRLRRLCISSLQRSREICIRLRDDEAHTPGLGNCVYDATVIEKSRLQGARTISLRRRCHEYVVLSLFGRFFWIALRQHFAVVHDDYVRATFRFVQVSGAREHSESAIVHELENDVPELTSG